MSRDLTPDLRINPPVLIDERELAFITGLCPRSIRNLVKAGVIPRIKIGRRVLFRWPQVEAALAKLETKVGAGALSES
jgi:hypothetical protein